MKILFASLITTGPSEALNSIHRISAQLEITGDVVKAIDLKMNCPLRYEISDQYLKLYGLTKEDIFKSPESELQFDKLVSLLNNYVNTHDDGDRLFLASFAPESTERFLKAIFERNNAKYKDFFWSNPINIKALATQYLLLERENIGNFKSGAVLKALQVPFEEGKLIDSSSLVTWEREMYQVLRKVFVPKGVREDIL